MEGMYGFHPADDYLEQVSMSPQSLVSPADYQSLLSAVAFGNQIPILGSDHLLSAASTAISATASSITPEIQGRGEEMSSAIRAKIAAHPRYPQLLEAYIDCQMVKRFFILPDISGYLRKKIFSGWKSFEFGALPRLS